MRTSFFFFWLWTKACLHSTCSSQTSLNSLSLHKLPMSFIMQAFCINRCQIQAFQITCCHPAEACRCKSLWIMLEGKREQVRRGGWRIQYDFLQFGFQQFEKSCAFAGCLHMKKDSFFFRMMPNCNEMKNSGGGVELPKAQRWNKKKKDFVID